MMRTILTLLPLVLLAGCQGGFGPRTDVVGETISGEMRRAIDNRQSETDRNRLSDLLMPPLAGGATGTAPPVEPRFDLVVNGAPAAQVFMAIVSSTRYSMLVPPEVSGSISVNLKNVTVREALDSLRELYGYEYRIQGSRIIVSPLTLQTKIFQVNYLTTQRIGRSDTRVTSGGLVGNAQGTQGAAATAAPATQGAATGGNSLAQQAASGTQVSTTNQSDFWHELGEVIRAIVGSETGGNVVISPQSGTVIVRAMPRTLREVDEFLRASRISVERQVMLEAKIVEVVLSEGFQSGINWTALDSRGNQRWSSGANASQINTAAPGLGANNAGGIVTPYDTDAGAFVPNTIGNVINAPLAGLAGRIAGSALGSVLGLAFTTNSFAALLSFLETQGTVHVLSSPRIATLNNQKAVLKVGTDDFYVTNISTTTTSSGSSSTVSPTITVQPFFSGISLDVTPQIDDDSNITLHVRPSVSVVSERNKVLSLGSLGTFQLPLASSNINETDSIVRVTDGNIVAIGGLMEHAQTDDTGKIPGAGDVPAIGEFFKHGRKAMQKRELVVLLKPTVIHGDKQWREDLERTQQRLESMRRPATPAQ